MFEFLIVAATVVLAVGLRTYDHPVIRKAGAAAVLCATYLGGFYLFDNHAAGLVAAAAWFLLPWVELLTRIRRLRLPVAKKLRRRPPPSADRFPGLARYTREIEATGFEYCEDTGWEWDGLRQFFRIFYHPEKRTQVAICINEQHESVFGYVALSSRTPDGEVWRTWNYPFSYTMKLSPDLHINRVTGAESFIDLFNEHLAFLARKGVRSDRLAEEDPEQLQQQIEEETHRQIRHNLDRGLIALSDSETFRYSWRGLFFLWRQFVKDMVKMC